MSCPRMLQLMLTTAMALSLAAPLSAQYQGYPATSPNYTTAPQRAQLPSWTSPLPPVSQPQPVHSSSQNVAPYAYSPSQMPSVSPFANVRSHQPQSQYQPASQPSYYAYPTSYDPAGNGPATIGDSPQHAVGGGLPFSPPVYSAPYADPAHSGPVGPAYSGPTQELMPAPAHNSYYDQPAQNYSQQADYGFGPKYAGGSSLAGPAMGIRNGWYGGAVGVVMTRSRANNLWLSYDQTNIRDRVLNSNDAASSWVGGAGANIGHYFNCGQNSIQFIYWGLYPGISEANAYGPDLDTIMHFDRLQYGPVSGAPVVPNLAGTFFFNAERHRVQQNYQLNNIELNLLGHNFLAPCCPLQLGWTAGVRYLRFDESFLYSTDVADRVFTGAPEEVHYSINTQNNLVGVQFGGQANYCVGPRLGLFANTKLGLFANQMSQQQQIYGAFGNAYVYDPGRPYHLEDVNASANKTSYAMIGALSVGANWQLSHCWSVNAGYQAMGVTGVALATNQVPGDFISALGSIRNVDSNGCVIFHGAFAGATFCF